MKSGFFSVVFLGGQQKKSLLYFSSLVGYFLHGVHHEFSIDRLNVMVLTFLNRVWGVVFAVDCETFSFVNVGTSAFYLLYVLMFSEFFAL